MAARKPLVDIGGQIQEIPASDTLDSPVTDPEVVVLTNNNAGSISIGQVIYIDVADGCDLAQADAAGTEMAFGLVKSSTISAAATGNIQTDGILAGAGSFTAGAKQFLDPTTPGGLTETAPTSSGDFVRQIGISVNTTDIMIDIDPSILKV
jgi:hypothetical protein